MGRISPLLFLLASVAAAQPKPAVTLRPTIPVFGLPMGAPLRLPPCMHEDETCMYPKGRFSVIRFSADEKPDLLADREVSARLIGGRLALLHFRASGDPLAALTVKFGAPTWHAKDSTSAEWDLPAVHVVFAGSGGVIIETPEGRALREKEARDEEAKKRTF